MRVNRVGLFLVLSILSAGLLYAGDVKVAVVDMTTVLKSFPETEKAEGVMEEQIKEFEAEKDSLMDEFEKKRGEFEALREKAQNKALSQEERDKTGMEAEKKFKELREEEMRIRKKLDTRQKELAEEKMRMYKNVTRKLQDVVGQFAKDKGYALVLDGSGVGINGMNSVMYSETRMDVTEDILKLIKSKKDKDEKEEKKDK